MLVPLLVGSWCIEHLLIDVIKGGLDPEMPCGLQRNLERIVVVDSIGKDTDFDPCHAHEPGTAYPLITNIEQLFAAQ